MSLPSRAGRHDPRAELQPGANPPLRPTTTRPPSRAQASVSSDPPSLAASPERAGRDKGLWQSIQHLFVLTSCVPRAENLCTKWQSVANSVLDNCQVDQGKGRGRWQDRTADLFGVNEALSR
jgi:hypothetical protein